MNTRWACAGSLTVWIALTDGKLPNWDAPRLKNRKPGRRRKYSDHAIETAVTVSMVFGLTSRQTEGFLRSLLGLLNLDSDVIACDLTSKSARDSTRVAWLVGQIDRPIASARADAAYDANGVYEAIDDHRADRSPRVLISPRKDAQLASESVSARDARWPQMIG